MGSDERVVSWEAMELGGVTIILLKDSDVPSSILGTFQAISHSIFIRVLQRDSLIIVPILQVRKLRSSEVQ